jgi:uncharacterized protein YndB with AHSA1/START domain
MEGADPIVVSVELPVPPGRAFAAFASGLAGWWPVATHSLSRQASSRCSLDARPGGALEEITTDGTRHRWGTVEAVDAGRRLRFSWHPGREAESAQWVEVRFEAVAAGCRVTLTHGGWEALGEIAPILRREYAAGWPPVLGESYARFAAARP